MGTIKTFTYTWWVEVDKIVGKDFVMSPEFFTELNKARFMWQLEFEPKSGAHPDKCSLFLSLLGIYGVKKRSIFASFAFNIASDNTIDGIVFKRDLYRKEYEFRLDTTETSSSSWGCSDFGIELFSAIPRGVTVFHGNVISISCKVYILADMFFDTLPDQNESKENDGNSNVWKLSVGLFNKYVSKGVKDSLTDVTITSSDGKEFFCHRYVLAAQSEVFKMMFENENFSENVEPRNIRVNDINGECMKEILNYIYTENVTLEKFTLESAIEHLYASKKYGLSELKSKCDKFLRKKINFENALKIIVEAEKYNLEILLDMSIHFVNHNFTELHAMEIWHLFARDHPDLVTLIMKVYREESPIECLPK